MAHGGKRDGSGRKPGSVTARTREVADAIMSDAGLTPLDYLMGIVRDVGADEAKRIDCAKAAAPYLHAKLANIDVNATHEHDMTEAAKSWLGLS